MTGGLDRKSSSLVRRSKIVDRKSPCPLEIKNYLC